MTPRRRSSCFPRPEGAPAPLRVTVERRVTFSDVDPMGIVWFGRYPLFFEAAAEELGRRCGLSYADFLAAGLRAPVAKMEVDYLLPMQLGELIRVTASLVWNDGARLNTEFELVKPDGRTAATGCTVQLFTEAATGGVLWVSPPLLERCRQRWNAGEFACLT